VDVHVELCWCEGDPVFQVTEAGSDLRVEADPRLSLAQVEQACAELGDRGDAVRRAWQERVGLSEELTANRRSWPSCSAEPGGMSPRSAPEHQTPEAPHGSRSCGAAHRHRDLRDRPSRLHPPVDHLTVL